MTGHLALCTVRDCNRDGGIADSSCKKQFDRQLFPLLN